MEIFEIKVIVTKMDIIVSRIGIFKLQLMMWFEFSKNLWDLVLKDSRSMMIRGMNVFLFIFKDIFSFEFIEIIKM